MVSEGEEPINKSYVRLKNHGGPIHSPSPYIRCHPRSKTPVARGGGEKRYKVKKPYVTSIGSVECHLIRFFGVCYVI